MRKRGGKSRGNRAYILLDVSAGKLEDVICALHSMAGVAMIDVLEGPPDVIMVLEASERQELAEMAVQALAAVETLTENIRLIPSRAYN